MKRVRIRVAEASRRTSPATSLSTGPTSYCDLPSQEQPALQANPVVAAAPQPIGSFERDALPHLDRIYCTALCMTGEPTDAETLVQDVFASAYVKFHEVAPGTDFRVWLYRILTATFVEAHRKQGGALRQLAELTTSAQAHLCVGEVRAALQSIPYDLRIVVHLADVENFSHEDIGHILGIPTAVVESRLRSGHRQLCIRLWGDLPRTRHRLLAGRRSKVGLRA
ncbi:MAG TPA: sigma factor [Jiangellaceae bacterium]